MAHQEVFHVLYATMPTTAPYLFRDEVIDGPSQSSISLITHYSYQPRPSLLARARARTTHWLSKQATKASTLVDSYSLTCPCPPMCGLAIADMQDVPRFSGETANPTSTTLNPSRLSPDRPLPRTPSDKDVNRADRFLASRPAPAPPLPSRRPALTNTPTITAVSQPGTRSVPFPAHQYPVLEEHSSDYDAEYSTTSPLVPRVRYTNIPFSVDTLEIERAALAQRRRKAKDYAKSKAARPAAPIATGESRFTLQASTGSGLGGLTDARCILSSGKLGHLYLSGIGRVIAPLPPRSAEPAAEPVLRFVPDSASPDWSYYLPRAVVAGVHTEGPDDLAELSDDESAVNQSL